MRTPIIAGNWKMNMTPAEAERLVVELIPLVKDAACEVVVCPPYVDLALVGKLLVGTNIKLGAQNIHWAPKGAFTGEISADMLLAMGVTHAIVGHSERRQYFGETDETVNKRAKAALDANITPIICVGETLEQREGGVTDTIVSKQTVAALAGFSAEEVARSVVAYEPIWAIGTGKTATPDQAEDVHSTIRFLLTSAFGGPTAGQVPILYGGSVKPQNANTLLTQPNTDGALVGGASLNPSDFIEIIKAATP